MKNKSDLRIVFIGTPEFAVTSLAAILESGFNVVAVITAPDKPAGRGLKLQASPVKQFAVSKNIPVLQPERLKNELFLNELKAFSADIQVVIAFRMLPEVVWNMPPLGTFNLHASLLPAYRGAAPINRAIMNGESKTGVSTFFLKHEIDTGPIAFQKEILITNEDDAGTLYNKLMNIGAELVVQTLAAVCSDSVPQISQHESPGLPVAPKIFKEDMLIDWNGKINEIQNQIRGLSPYPGAFTYLNGKVMKVFKTNSMRQGENEQALPGTYVCDGKKNWWVYCADGAMLQLLDIQVEGKKRMTVEEYLRGAKVEEHGFFG